MRKTYSLTAVIAVVFMLTPVVGAQRPETRRPATPMLTNDDVSSPRSVTSRPEETISRTSSTGSALRNPRAVLESALTKLGEVNSVRTRMQSSMTLGAQDVLIESVKPDRMHVTSAYGEMIMIGRKFYMKSAGGWQVTSSREGMNQSDAGLDFRTLVKQMLAKTNIKVTGQILGGETIDGVEAVAYEFSVTDGVETGTINVSVGKDDGYMRRMSLSGGPINVRMWFTDINQPISIEPPM